MLYLSLYNLCNMPPTTDEIQTMISLANDSLTWVKLSGEFFLALQVPLKTPKPDYPLIADDNGHGGYVVIVYAIIVCTGCPNIYDNSYNKIWEPQNMSIN